MIGDIFYRLRALFRRRAVESELDDELRFHLERQAETHRQSGMSPEDAARRARLSFGGPEQVREECRDARGTRWLEDLLQDVRYGFRALRHSPVFALVAILSLGLGIGANTAIFSIVNSVLLRSLPYHEPQQLVMIWDTFAGSGDKHNVVSPAEYLHWQQENTPFEQLAV